MRMTMLAIAAVVGCAALPATAQDRPQAPVPAQNPAQAQELPKDQTQVPAQVQPESVPKSQPKAQDRVQDQSAPAAASVQPVAPSRFAFKRVDNSFLRLDHDTGQVAFCRPHDSGWACEAVPEERAALEKEIARLQDEVTTLKTQVARLTAPPPHPVPPQTVPPSGADKNGGGRINLPSAEDLARARAFIVTTWRRLVEMISDIQKDMMQKG